MGEWKYKGSRGRLTDTPTHWGICQLDFDIAPEDTLISIKELFDE